MLKNASKAKNNNNLTLSTKITTTHLQQVVFVRQLTLTGSNNIQEKSDDKLLLNNSENNDIIKMVDTESDTKIEKPKVQSGLYRYIDFTTVKRKRSNNLPKYQKTMRS